MKQKLIDFYKENKPPLDAYFISRFIILITSYLTLAKLPVRPDPGVWRGIAHNIFLDGLARWDAGWYLSIAKNGYTHVPQPGGQIDSAFFPLYPLLMGFVGDLLGGRYLPSGILLSHLFFLGAVIFLYKWIKEIGHQKTSETAVWLLCFFPTTFFFSSVYTESMFLFFSVAAFYFAEKQKWILAALFAGA